MSSIGPQIPAHLRQQLQRPQDNEDDEDEGPQPLGPRIGPTIPGPSKVAVFDEDDEDGSPQPKIKPNIGPLIPPETSKSSKKKGHANEVGPVGPSLPPQIRPSKKESPPPGNKRILGPSFPSYAPTYNPDAYLEDDDDDDDDVGPQPLPAGMQHEQKDAVKEFMEREEKRKKAAEDALKPKAPKRDEWMLVPPTNAGLLANLDPTKLKGRQFSRGTTAPSNSDTSLWTETPAERQQRLADEVSGKKRRVTEAPVEDEDEVIRKRRRKQDEEVIRKGVNEHTRSKRGAALVEQHADTLTKKPTDKEVPVIWDHSRDMGLGGRLMDDDKRDKMLKEAKGLGDRFGSGRSGGFL
ncbi:hypothetical protein CPB83DRAFT_856774 [Crepidotus variabilis]|uniref:DUF3752 domain-containing protein n=1 Tax=Crepidotus variabilis TaxID=179855 RepID=A0A9P6JNG3_9AGAR|nr:hypothetical protein CPB83DRAFT_856774 [Crepidotus variabilis]